MNLEKFFGPLGKPWFAVSLVFGSFLLAGLLAVSDPTPIRQSLGWAKAKAVTPSSQNALVASSQTNKIASPIVVQSKQNAVPEQTVAIIDKEKD